jgi:hypothetical protein
METPNVATSIGAHVSQELLDRLHEVFPLRPPHINDADRMIWFKAGEQGLIEFLEFARQEYLSPQQGA